MFSKLIILFFIYSVIGYICEVINCYMANKKLKDRGFLLGPYCPIYGFGAILLTLTLTKYKTDLLILLSTSMIICGLLEYLTSYVLEKIFKMRWWDYSNKKYNINGRICLETLIPFSIGGVIIIKFLNPIFFNMINNINIIFLRILAFIISCILIIDLTISLNIAFNFKKIAKKIKKDSTEEIKEYIQKYVINKSLYKRLINAFPSLKRSKRSKRSKKR